MGEACAVALATRPGGSVVARLRDEGAPAIGFPQRRMRWEPATPTRHDILCSGDTVHRSARSRAADPTTTRTSISKVPSGR
jgi:hypothetical protein